MPSSTFFGMQHLNNNMICAVRVDVTNPDPELAEPIEVCVLPLNQFIEVHPKLIMFNVRLKPNYPEHIDYKFCRLTRPEIAGALISGFDQDKCKDMLMDWFKEINMPYRKNIIPLGYLWPVDRERLIRWMGYDDYSVVFSEDHRDVRLTAHYINDRFECRGEPVPFSKQDLRWIAKQFNIEKLEQGGSCIDDCRTIAETYKKQLKMLLLC